jgi:DHA1 family multidrug/chloramphenicol efflux transport protein-like MFS transporter
LIVTDRLDFVMSDSLKISTINFSSLLFPFALVLFEFSVYIANDMAQPAMLFVVKEFGVSTAWVPVAMTAFILGGAALSWLPGPWSDRVGRRPVMLGGVIYFLVTCLATYLVYNIETFMALRVLQGVGLCLIGAVGYAVIQEAYEERSAVKVTALMANVSLIAPMVGPLAGAALVAHAPWRSCFLLIASTTLIALIGLWRTMPETVDPHTEKAPFSQVLHEYIALFGDKHFVLSALCLPLICIPLVGWIAISPVWLVDDLRFSMLEYGLWQLPVFGSLILGNLFMARWSDRWPLGQTALASRWPILLGLLIALVGLFMPTSSPIFIVTGISLISVAVGLSFPVLYRFTLMSSTLPKGTVSAGLSIIILGGQALGIELLRIAYVHWNMAGFVWATIFFSGVFILLSRPRIRHEMAIRRSRMNPPELK